MKLKSLLLNSAILATLIGGIAVAQVITQSVQMSQDPRGPIAVDTNLGVYLPQHLLNSGAAPTVTGTGAPTVVGSDTQGTVTMGTSATTATVLFAKAFNSVPNCIAAPQANNATASPISYTVVATSIAMVQGATSGNKWTYLCMSTS